MFPKMSEYGKNFKETKYVFLIKDNELVENLG